MEMSLDTVTNLGLNKRPESPLNKRIQLKMCIMYTLNLHDRCFDWTCIFFGENERNLKVEEKLVGGTSLFEYPVWS